MFLIYTKDRIGVVTAIDLVGESVVAEIFLSLLGVLYSVKEALKSASKVEDKAALEGEDM